VLEITFDNGEIEVILDRPLPGDNNSDRLLIDRDKLLIEDRRIRLSIIVAVIGGRHRLMCSSAHSFSHRRKSSAA
jgi:hypothetical protein